MSYRAGDREEKLGPVPEGGFQPTDPNVIAWEAAHGHDLRLKCLPEFGCQLAEDDLRRAIEEHRSAIQDAGSVKVQPGYEQVAEAKHRADERLWSALDGITGEPRDA